MNSNMLNLNYIIDLKKFQKIQDDIATVTRMAILTVNYKGLPITRHSACSDFCQKIRENPYYRKLCERCDSRGGLEAARVQEPYIYLCHMGIVDFAIPIIVDEKYLGAVMAGQVLLNETESKSLERIFYDSHYTIHLYEDESLQSDYNKMPLMRLEQIKAVADMMMNISNYIVEEAIIKSSLYDMNQKMISLIRYGELRLKKEEISMEDSLLGDTKRTKNRMSSELMGINEYLDRKHIKNSLEPYSINKILKPAIDFIQQNPNRKILLDEMALLCNISSSYFSKLFRKEMGESLSEYVNKVKMNYAKELLKTTDMKITEISNYLGFEDCGYFIKIFKKLTSYTPAKYRKIKANS